MSKPIEVPVRRFTQEEVRNAGPDLTKSGFVTGDAHDATVAVLRAQIADLTADKQRLDSGRIVTQERDEFGQPYNCERRGVDLRAAIDEAIALALKDEASAFPWPEAIR
ncbi:hypothetical protein [Pseudomonas sp. PNPG3]|uniref:hypothetical protein n=1 Tax=Pseudomonas sp. PNPG3 TaxID=2919497 RepID=UPI001FFDB022|nr:hypothetical protein [Pseudomonas sp. PNPG3]MCK2122168.1 hypothetical protein [Pseudomonas sp. PNPG3]